MQSVMLTIVLSLSFCSQIFSLQPINFDNKYPETSLELMLKFSASVLNDLNQIEVCVPKAQKLFYIADRLRDTLMNMVSEICILTRGSQKGGSVWHEDVDYILRLTNDLEGLYKQKLGCLPTSKTETMYYLFGEAKGRLKKLL